MTADERIEQLLKRAGYPIMVVKNGEIHSIVRKFDTIKLAADSMTHSLNKGDDQRGVPHAVMAMLYSNIFGLLIREKDMVDTIDRLEAALENALNERDALLEDVKMTDILCETCAHCDAHSELCDAAKCDCLSCTVACECKTCEGKHNYIWRGVPDKED